MFANPQSGASLQLAWTARHSQSKRNTVVIFGRSKLTANRVFQCLEADYSVLLAIDCQINDLDAELVHRIQLDQIKTVNLNADSLRNYFDQNLDLLSKIAFLVVTDTPSGSATRSKESAALIRQECDFRSIPLCIADMPFLSDFTFPTTHRFTSKGKGRMSPLQLAITTNASSCRLASRLRRQIVSSLPDCVGDAVERVDELRALVRRNSAQGDPTESDSSLAEHINKAVNQRCKRPRLSAGYPDTPPMTPPSEKPLTLSHQTGALDAKARMRFIAQISEYWPMDSLAHLTDDEALALLELDQSHDAQDVISDQTLIDSRHELVLRHPPAKKAKGKIFLVGSGPGSPQLLTRAAYELLTKQATVVLSDKLVPEAVLALIPPHIKVTIAKKFPGNAEGAQSELIDLSLQAARNGETVVRLKQGDIFLYGRGGEEVLAFRAAGFEPAIIPGLSSTLSGPSMANIPVTQRGVAESVTICTGVGRGGRGVSLPGYERSRTLVILMGVARLAGVVRVLTSASGQEDGREGGGRDGQAYPSYLPVAVIERASSPDQRVIASTLDQIVEAIERLDEQRAPAMIVVGWSVLALARTGHVDVLDDASNKAEDLETLDKNRIDKWLEGQTAFVEDGLPNAWSDMIDVM